LIYSKRGNADAEVKYSGMIPILAGLISGPINRRRRIHLRMLSPDPEANSILHPVDDPNSQVETVNRFT
jgi:hypothetical protein